MDTSVIDPVFVEPPPPQPVGIYGWRKRCVYAFLLVLMVVIVINIALTIWILRVLHFSFNGISGMKFAADGVELNKDTEFSKPVYVEQIKSVKNKPLYMMSHQDVQLLQTDRDNHIQSRLVLGPDSVEVTCDKFIVKDFNGRISMKVEGDDVFLGTKDARYPGEIEFGSSVSTPTVRSPKGEPLRVEAFNSRVHVNGMGGIGVNSDAGNVTIGAKDDVYISSTVGAIHIQSSNVFIKNLPKAATLPSSSSSSSSLPSSNTDVYQLCACANGKLFLAPSFGDCELDPSVCS